MHKIYFTDIRAHSKWINGYKERGKEKGREIERKSKSLRRTDGYKYTKRDKKVQLVKDCNRARER